MKTGQEKKRLRRAMPLICIAVVILLLPLGIQSNYIITVAVTCFLFSCFGVCWNMISGYGGQISWCHAVFVSIGAYTTILMNNLAGWSPFVAIPVSMALSFIISTVIGKISFRYRGPFFSITTIAFAEIVRVLLLNFRDFTGGSAGITRPYIGASFWNLMFKNDTPFYYISFGLMAGVVYITYRFEKSKTGYYLKAIKGDEDAAISLGIDTSRIKLTAFQLSAVLTAVIGVFYGAFINYVQPNTICGMDFSVQIGSVVIVGGLGTVWGSMIGAFILIPLIELANILLGAQGGAQLLYGLALIFVVIAQPRGVIYLFSKENRDRIARKLGKSAKKTSGKIREKGREDI